MSYQVMLVELFLLVLILLIIAQIYIDTKTGCEYIYNEPNQNFSYNISMLHYRSWFFGCEDVLK